MAQLQFQAAAAAAAAAAATSMSQHQAAATASSMLGGFAPVAAHLAGPKLPAPADSVLGRLLAAKSGPLGHLVPQQQQQLASPGAAPQERRQARPPTQQAQPLDQHAHRLAAAANHAAGGHCLFVYNLAPEVEESAIWKLFGPFGAVQQVNLVRDSSSNKCRGFAFVTMSEQAQASRAVQALDGHLLANRKLQVSFKSSKVRRTMPAEEEAAA